MHFVLSAIAFFMLVLVFGGFLSDNGFGPSMAIIVIFSLCYWIAIGLKALIKKLGSRFSSKTVIRQIKRFAPAAFALFTAVLFALTAFSIIGGELFDLKVTMKTNENSWWPEDREEVTEYTTIITPLTPTVNNYLRYLGSALVIVLGIALLYLKFNTVFKVVLNFCVIAGGLSLIWLAQLKFFTLGNILIISVVSFLAAYFVTLISASIVLFVRKRRREADEEYESQFSVGKKSKNNA